MLAKQTQRTIWSLPSSFKPQTCTAADGPQALTSHTVTGSLKAEHRGTQVSKRASEQALDAIHC